MYTIKEYIKTYYCVEEQTEIVNSLMRQYEFDDTIICYNQFEYYNTGLQKIIYIKEDNYDIKFNGDIIPFNKIVKWTLLKFNKFHELLVEMGYPVCIKENNIWWGELTIEIDKFKKINKFFDQISGTINPDYGVRINLSKICNLYRKAKIEKHEIKITSYPISSNDLIENTELIKPDTENSNKTYSPDSLSSSNKPIDSSRINEILKYPERGKKYR